MPRRRVVRWYRDPVDMHEIHVDGLPPHNLLASRCVYRTASLARIDVRPKKKVSREMGDSRVKRGFMAGVVFQKNIIVSHTDKHNRIGYRSVHVLW